MILQRDPNLRKEIQKYGCYFMALLWYGNKLACTALDPITIDEEIYTHCIKREWMNKNCYIFNPSAILEYAGVKNIYLGHKPADYECRENEFEISKWSTESTSHFVASDNGVVTYDPWGVSKTVKYGILKSKRIFRATGGIGC